LRCAGEEADLAGEWLPRHEELGGVEGEAGLEVDAPRLCTGMYKPVEEDAEEEVECSGPASEETLARGMAMGLDMMIWEHRRCVGLGLRKTDLDWWGIYRK